MKLDQISRRAWGSLLTCLALVLTSPESHSKEVYREVDKDGKVIFTDNPHSEGEPVEVKEPNTVKGVQSRPQNAGVTYPNAATHQYSVAITNPSDQQVFPNRLLPVNVSATTSPELKPGFSLRLLVDGKPQSQEKKLVVEGLSIGSHTLQVQIVDRRNAVIAESEVVTIHTRQPGN